MIYQPSVGTGYKNGLVIGINALLILTIVSAFITVILHCSFGYKVIGLTCL